jgi:type IV pilus assembly protein PilB
MIVERRPGSEVRRAAEAEGLTSLRESALQKVFTGISTLHEINRVTFVEEVSAVKMAAKSPTATPPPQQ